MLETEGRRSHLGTMLDCPLCDRAELPDGLRLIRSTPEWSELTMPAGLRQAHRVSQGTWGRIVVHRGQLRFLARTEPELAVVVVAGSNQAIPPEVVHQVQPLGSVSFSIDFLSVDEPKPITVSANDGQGGERAGWHVGDEGGDPVCWAHLLCPECGIVLEGGSHRSGCSLGSRP